MAVSEQQKIEVKRLLAQGSKIEAIKYLRKEFNLDLKSAQELANHIDDELNPSDFTTTSINVRVIKRKASKLFGQIFLGIGFLFLAIVAINIFLEFKYEENSIRLNGVVISNPSQPTIEYEFEGSKFYYYSTTSSNPPSYYIGEEVEILIEPTEPNDAVVNTITDRWLGTIVLASIGLIFTIVGISVNKIF